MLSPRSDDEFAVVERELSAAPAIPLAHLRVGQRARVREIRLPNSAHGHGVQLVLRLLEIGFVPDEIVRVTAVGPGGAEPLAVRVGGTMFALRRHEAEHILVDLLEAAA